MQRKIIAKKKKKKITTSAAIQGSMQNPYKSLLHEFNKKHIQLKGDFNTPTQFGKSIKKNRFNRVIGTHRETEQDGTIIISTINVSEEYLTPIVKFNNEAIPFLFHINGCAKNFLLFIAVYLLDVETGNYKVNAHIYKLFMEYAFDVFGETYKLDTIKQCHRELVEKNMICNVETGIYKINPLIISMGGDTKKRQLFHDYTELLISKGKDPVEDFYPLFKK
jgi:hypothetical protein